MQIVTASVPAYIKVDQGRRMILLQRVTMTKFNSERCSLHNFVYWPACSIWDPTVYNMRKIKPNIILTSSEYFPNKYKQLFTIHIEIVGLVYP